MPDLNTVPPSPHSLTGTASISPHRRRRRSSAAAQMATSAVAPSQPPPSSSSPSAINILPSNQGAVGQHGPASSLPSPQFATQQPPAAQDSGVGPGPGPLRHPRPLTASELHMQLEKEQEAVVNRLTRELTLLRAAHNASVASNTSSISATTSAHDPIAEASLLSGSGFSIPTSSRHHRASSSASQPQQQPLASSYEARSQAGRPPYSASLSRQNSAASRRSLTGSPAPPSSFDPSTYFHQQRVPGPGSVMMSSVVATPGSSIMGDQMSPGLMPATLRYEETAYYRSELESAKRENEALKRRIRELERVMRERRASDASRTRSDSVSTTASASIAAGGGVGIAGPRDIAAPRPERTNTGGGSSGGGGGGVSIGPLDDEVKVGESAATGRLGQPSQRRGD